MCGIAGYITFSQTAEVSVLEKMIQTLKHRGPDSISFEVFNTNTASIGMAHARLSIIDLSDRAKQPMTRDEISIVFNGEIYNYKELRNILEQKGVVFNSDSDTEVILKAYMAWGIDCVNRFIGMFAFVIYDKPKNKIILCRDRAGVKPLYFYQNNNTFLFASEIKAFHKHPEFIKQINTDAVYDFIQFGSTPFNSSVYKGVKKVKPGTFLEMNLENKSLNETIYWNVEDFYLKPKENLSFNDALIQTESILESAFKYRLVSDVPVGVFLSGGIDSSLLAGMLQKNSSDKINTFTIGVSDKKYNEASEAKGIASYLGTNHHELFCSERDFIELVPKLTDVFDEPFADSSAIPTLLVSSMASQHVKVALSADGGDEAFAGYNRYDYLNKHWHFFSDSNAFKFKLVKSLLCNKFIAAKIPAKYENSFQKFCSVLNTPDLITFIHNLNTSFTNENLTKLLGGRKYSQFNYHDLIKKSTAEKLSALSFMMLLDFKQYLPDDILQKVDRCSMAYGLEAREPYLDHRIIEWVAALPDGYKYHNGIKKHLLKEISYKYVPKELLNKPKKGFSVPLNRWLRSNLKEYTLSYLNTESLKKHNLFNDDYLNDLTKRFYYNGESWQGLRIWNLLCFQMWYEKWMV